ncbi:hypothetical protein Bbelb_096130 [Branchiostoma belcheri]|nr:hypothetical protein Bbelb_096130 [Branchiostoma belcheri]
MPEKIPGHRRSNSPSVANWVFYGPGSSLGGNSHTYSRDQHRVTNTPISSDLPKDRAIISPSGGCALPVHRVITLAITGLRGTWSRQERKPGPWRLARDERTDVTRRTS